MNMHADMYVCVCVYGEKENMSKWINKIKKKWTTPHVISVYWKVLRIIRKTNLLPSVRALPERFNWAGSLALHMGGTILWRRGWKLSTSIHHFLLPECRSYVTSSLTSVCPAFPTGPLSTLFHCEQTDRVFLQLFMWAFCLSNEERNIEVPWKGVWSICHKKMYCQQTKTKQRPKWSLLTYMEARVTTKDIGRERMLHFIWIIITNLQCCEYVLKFPELQNFKLWVLLYVKYISKKLWKNVGWWGNSEMVHQVKVLLDKQAWVPPQNPREKSQMKQDTWVISTCLRWDGRYGYENWPDAWGSAKLEHSALQKQETLLQRGRRELTPKCYPLTSTHTSWHAHARAHRRTLMHTPIITNNDDNGNKTKRRRKERKRKEEQRKDWVMRDRHFTDTFQVPTFSCQIVFP